MIIRVRDTAPPLEIVMGPEAGCGSTDILMNRWDWCDAMVEGDEIGENAKKTRPEMLGVWGGSEKPGPTCSCDSMSRIMIILIYCSSGS